MSMEGVFDPEEVAAAAAQIKAELEADARSDDPRRACYARLMLTAGLAFNEVFDKEITNGQMAGVGCRAVADLCASFIIQAAMATVDVDRPHQSPQVALAVKVMLIELGKSLHDALSESSTDTILTVKRKPLSS